MQAEKILGCRHLPFATQAHKPPKKTKDCFFRSHFKKERDRKKGLFGFYLALYIYLLHIFPDLLRGDFLVFHSSLHYNVLSE